MAFPWIIISILITLIVIFAGIAMAARKKKKPMTYKHYFYMGFSWLVTGLLVGVVYPLLLPLKRSALFASRTKSPNTSVEPEGVALGATKRIA
jgi:hypothetical protein